MSEVTQKDLQIIPGAFQEQEKDLKIIQTGINEITVDDNKYGIKLNPDKLKEIIIA